MSPGRSKLDFGDAGLAADTFTIRRSVISARSSEANSFSRRNLGKRPAVIPAIINIARTAKRVNRGRTLALFLAGGMAVSECLTYGSSLVFKLVFPNTQL